MSLKNSASNTDIPWYESISNKLVYLPIVIALSWILLLFCFLCGRTNSEKHKYRQRGRPPTTEKKTYGSEEYAESDKGIEINGIENLSPSRINSRAPKPKYDRKSVQYDNRTNYRIN